MTRRYVRAQLAESGLELEEQLFNHTSNEVPTAPIPQYKSDAHLPPPGTNRTRLSPPSGTNRARISLFPL